MAGHPRRPPPYLKTTTTVFFCCLFLLFFNNTGWCAPAATEAAGKLTQSEKEVTVKKAVDAYKKKDLDAARQGLELARTDYPDNYAIPYYLGLIYLEQGNVQAAIKQWQRYVHMDPDSKNAKTIRKYMTLLLKKQARKFAKQAVANEAALIKGQSDENTIAVTSFSNLGSETLGPLGKGFAAMLITDLSQVPELQVVDRIKLHALLEEMKLGASGLVDAETAPKIGKLLKARHVTSGSMVDLEKEKLIIASAVMDTEQSTSIGSQAAKGELKSFYQMEKKIACQIVKDLGRDCEAMPKAFNTVHTKSMPALTAFSQGLVYFDAENYEEAREMFQQALEHDPKFYLAMEALWATPTPAMLFITTSQIISNASASGPASSAAGTTVAGTSGSSTTGTAAATTATTTTTTATTVTAGSAAVGLPPATMIAGGAAAVGGGLALAGGGGGGDGGSSPNSDALDLTGDWRGTWVNGLGETGEALFFLTQSNTSITGTVSITGDACLTTGDITGTVSGQNANLTIQSGGENVTLDARADQSAKTLNGTFSYNASALGCSEDSGSFTTDLTTGGADLDW